MSKRIGIRREDKNEWERRVPIIPDHARVLQNEYGVEICVQSQHNRAYSDEEYREAGIAVQNEIDHCPIVMGVKEIPAEKILSRKTYIFFSHTIKGQAYNMPMLKRILDLGSTLIDYECITDDQGRRLVFFGRYAGLAGMIDTLHVYGRMLARAGAETPLLGIKPAYEYPSLDQAFESIANIGKELTARSLPDAVVPVVVGFAGYGQVSRGAQEIYDLLRPKEITPAELVQDSLSSRVPFYKVVFREEDMVVPVDPSGTFELQDYYDHPEKYRSQFERYLPELTILVNGIYWEEKYPRLVTKAFLKNYFRQSGNRKLQLISDISCDINGAIECTEKATEPDEPAFVYDPLTDSIADGIEGDGLVILAVDNLPTELARDASRSFSEALWKFIPGISRADDSGTFEQYDPPPAIKRAVIVYKGELTPDYHYLHKYID